MRRKRTYFELNAQHLREGLEAQALARRGDAITARRAAVLGRQLLRRRKAACRQPPSRQSRAHLPAPTRDVNAAAPVQAVAERLCEFASGTVPDIQAQVQERLERLALVVAPPARDLGAELAREGAVHDAGARQGRVVGVRGRGRVQQVERCVRGSEVSLEGGTRQGGSINGAQEMRNSCASCWA